MGFDWETILDARGVELAEAYEDAIAKATLADDDPVGTPPMPDDPPAGKAAPAVDAATTAWIMPDDSPEPWFG